MPDRCFLPNFTFNTKGVLPDTNIWGLYYGWDAIRPGTKYVANVYAEFLKDCKRKGTKIYGSPLVIGEFYHKSIAIARRVENLKRKKNNLSQLDNDGFLKTPEYIAAQKDAVSDINAILGFIDQLVVQESETTNDINTYLARLSNSEIGFTDLMIERQAKENDIYLLTHDSDFSQPVGNIVSFNAQLCPRS